MPAHVGSHEHWRFCMDFFEQQDRAHRKTVLLVAYFVAAVALIILAVYLAVAGVFFYGQSGGPDGDAPTGLWFPNVFVAVTAVTLLVVGAGSLYKIAVLSGGGEVVARSLGARPVLRNTQNLSERILFNVVEEMALASGTPVPPVYVLDNESAINAFAAGTTPQNAVITVTRGALEMLKRDELQGVIGHEFSHILNGDMRLNLRLMGVLNGILAIALIGSFLMWTTWQSSYVSDSRSDDRRGGNPLPFLGFLLYIIGYIGVLFGHLIKSAVSRQREFLADASAVQFTRYPKGIADALKKIGGLERGARLETPNAEEASHMFFGNALAQSFFYLLSTHPPLAERIRRIEPNFDGQFPRTIPVQHSVAELIDPRTLSEARRTLPLVPAAVGAAAQGFAFQPSMAVSQIGSPQTKHIDYAQNVVAALPPQLAAEVKNPLGAVAAIYALLLNDREPEVRENQLKYLSTRANPQAYQETLRIVPVVQQVTSEAKLPLVSMALPALHELSSPQIAAFYDDIGWLIKADKTVSLFEYAVHRLVFKRLIPRLQGQAAAPVKYGSMTPLMPACTGLLSTLAYEGKHEDQVAKAFQQGMAALLGDASGVPMLPREQCDLKVIDSALDLLSKASPKIKKSVISACAQCIDFDGNVTVEEAELLRVISDALECPMPPLLGQGLEEVRPTSASSPPVRALPLGAT